MLSKAEILDVLRRSELFRLLDDELIQDYVSRMDHHRLGKHAVALDAIATDERFYVILQGRVKLYSSHPDADRELTLFLLGPGDGFDVVTLLDGQHHELAAETLDEVEVLSAPMEEVRLWISRHPDFNRTFLPYLGGKMAQLAELARDLSLHDTSVRLARLIVRHVDDEDPQHPVRLINDLSHEELGRMIGTVRVVTNRQIQNLKRQGLIDARRGHLVVKDLQALAEKSRTLIDS
jgi:CRP-like cAMP-binding protein